MRRSVLIPMPCFSALTFACFAATGLVFTMSPRRVAAVAPTQTGATPPTFAAVSIKACAGRGAGGGGGNQTVSPGRVVEECMSPMSLVQEAYLHFANGRVHPPWTARPRLISGGPDWMKFDRYTIEAVADGVPPGPMMLGPMMQAVLEERFKLKVHRESKEVPVYDLSVASTGAKVSPFQEGTCAPVDWTQIPPPPLGPGQRRCNAGSTFQSTKVVWDVEAMSLDEFAAMFGGFLDRPVVNTTGIVGLVSFHLEYDQGSPGDLMTSTVFAAFKQQLGLELRPAQGHLDLLVVDHVERPSPDGPIATFSSR